MTEPLLSAWKTPAPAHDFAARTVAAHLARRGRKSKGPWLLLLAAIAVSGVSFARTEASHEVRAQDLSRATGALIARRLEVGRASIRNFGRPRIVAEPLDDFRARRPPTPIEPEQRRPLQHQPLCDCGPGAIVCSCAP